MPRVAQATEESAVVAVAETEQQPLVEEDDDDDEEEDDPAAFALAQAKVEERVRWDAEMERALARRRLRERRRR
jgi:hypothetical protein